MSSCSQALWDMKREALVPISLDIERHGEDGVPVRVVDTFVWDLHQEQISPEQFARRMSEELGLSRNFVRPVAQSISQQVLDIKRKFGGCYREGTTSPAAENIRVIDVDVRFRSVIYRDRLQWDINCLYNSPERFARCTVADLSLPQEMEAAIAFTIHEQLFDLRVAAVHSASDDGKSISTDTIGPRLSSLQPVDQYEFNARDWTDHRPASHKPGT